MRKGLTFEASKDLHRRRARTLIFASVAALVLGSTVSAAVAAAWGADRRDAAEARFQDVVSLQRGRIEDTVRAYRRMLTVTQGFFEVEDPTDEQFYGFTDSLELPDAHPSVIALQFIRRVQGRAAGDVGYPVTMVAPRAAAPTLLGHRPRRRAKRARGARSRRQGRRRDDDAARAEHLPAVADAAARPGAS